MVSSVNSAGGSSNVVHRNIGPNNHEDWSLNPPQCAAELGLPGLWRHIEVDPNRVNSLSPVCPRRLVDAIRLRGPRPHADSPSRSAARRPHRRGRGDRAAGGGDQGAGRERARRRGDHDRGRDRGRRAKADPRRRRRARHGRSGSRTERRAARDVENPRRRSDRDRNLRLPRRGAALDRLGVAARNPHPRRKARRRA